MQKLIIKGRLPGMNEIIGNARANKRISATQKRQYTQLVAWSCIASKLKPIEYKADFKITWYCKNKRRDKDNIMSGQKFIFDGLQVAKIINNDGWSEIGNIYHIFEVDKEERIEVEITRSKDD